MLVEFSLWNLPGWVGATVEPNDDPESLGQEATARDFPVCTATVSYRGHGYRAALGWIQLVNSTDNSSSGAQFEMDPFEPLGALAHPFCFFGFSPTLFDAPSRDSRDSLTWTAHSFLAFIGEESGRPEARALLGFSWGFSIQNKPSPTKRLPRSRRQPGKSTGHSWPASIPSGTSPTATATTSPLDHSAVEVRVLFLPADPGYRFRWYRPAGVGT